MDNNKHSTPDDVLANTSKQPHGAQAKKKQEEPTQKPNPSSRKRIFTPLIALISLIVAGGAGFQTWKLQQQLQVQKDGYDRDIQAIKNQQDTALGSLQQTTQAWHDSETQLKARVNELTNNLQATLRQRNYQNQDWLLLKVRHYLELAQINEHWSDDLASVVALLQQADTLLKTQSDQRLFPIRQAIASEISQLQAVPTIDVAGVLSQLDAAQEAVATLPFKQSVISPPPNNGSLNKVDTSSSTWRTKLEDSVNMLKTLVVIRRNDEDIKPLLSPMNQALLRDNIRMNFQEAQWAVLQHNPEVYQLALKHALNLINSSFETQAESTQSLINRLNILQQINLNPQKPKINQSLILLNHLIGNSDSGEKAS
jgi:uroporphyrin-3 C-methyltransferase